MVPGVIVNPELVIPALGQETTRLLEPFDGLEVNRLPLLVAVNLITHFAIP